MIESYFYSIHELLVNILFFTYKFSMHEYKIEWEINIIRKEI